MRINCHTHIFNAKSVFTRHTVDILLQRIREWEFPDFVEKAVHKQLNKIVKEAGPYVDEDVLLANILKEISPAERVKEALTELQDGNELSLVIEGPTDRLEEMGAEALMRLFDRISDALGKSHKDARKGNTVSDIIDFLRIGLQPSIRNVTRIIMNQIGKQDAIVALMMDITKDGKDKGLFEQQLKDTSQMVLTYPGRVFPFIAINTKRPNHFEFMERALNGMGYVGVKLYPSLGYAIDSDKMYRVYAYCEKRSIPLLMHCSKGGFYYKDSTRKKSSPELWKPILEKHPNLKICFGHFGGDKNLVKGAIPENSWTQTIIDLMNDDYPGVYADIARHSAPMEGGKAEKNYFRNIKELLKTYPTKRHILFGTDYFLARQRLKEENHWRYFKKRFSEQEFKLITEHNPADFLGLPRGNRRADWNMRNYAEFVANHPQEVEAEPTPWVKRTIKDLRGEAVTFSPNLLGGRWSENNKVHKEVYQYFYDNPFGMGRRRRRPFAESGTMLLSEMRYFRMTGSVTIKAGYRETMANDLHKKLAAEYDPKKDKITDKEKSITKILKDGGKTLSDLGVNCDILY